MRTPPLPASFPFPDVAMAKAKALALPTCDCGVLLPHTHLRGGNLEFSNLSFKRTSRGLCRDRAWTWVLWVFASSQRFQPMIRLCSYDSTIARSTVPITAVRSAGIIAGNLGLLILPARLVEMMVIIMPVHGKL